MDLRSRSSVFPQGDVTRTLLLSPVLCLLPRLLVAIVCASVLTLPQVGGGHQFGDRWTSSSSQASKWKGIAIAAAASQRTQVAQAAPTLYSTYVGHGIVNPSGPALESTGNTFRLNGKDIQIFSGAMHYFRVVPDYWRDRLRRLRACGLNAVETYVPWNMHEEIKGQFDFSGAVNLRRFIQIAKEEDLFVILRPGPYICAEWDYGGLPSWLLRENEIKVRTSDPIYLYYMQRYLRRLMAQVHDAQFTYGGAIIAVQIENEYGSFGDRSAPRDKEYLRSVKKILEESGIVEMFFTSDGVSISGMLGAVEDVLMTANFQHNPQVELDRLLQLQPNRPLMVMEFWAGWFDHWGENHNVYATESFRNSLMTILQYNASVNFYMFHGGTNFGFMNGANVEVRNNRLIYQPTITSYDYDAPLSEAGHYTQKYDIIRSFLREISSGKPWDVPIPAPPAINTPKALEPIQITSYLSLNDLLQTLEIYIASKYLVPMELLKLGDSGQGYGFIVYRTKLLLQPEGVRLDFSAFIHDRCQVLINGKEVATIYVNEDIPTLSLTADVPEVVMLDLVVENMGRINFGSPIVFGFENASKGIFGDVYRNGVRISEWNIFPLEFKPASFQRLSLFRWRPYLALQEFPKPGLFKGTFQLATPHDTFLRMSKWTKGVVFVNGFNLGRYWSIGPQQTLYLPAPLLRKGSNEIVIFELHREHAVIESQAFPMLSTAGHLQKLDQVVSEEEKLLLQMKANQHQR